MKFGVREICNVVFRSKERQRIGKTMFEIGQPVIYIDTAKTSAIEGTADTTYATGGRGNNRLMAWEGNKTMTFTVEDALISPEGLAILSGAELFEGDDYVNSEEAYKNKVHVHKMVFSTPSSTGVITLKGIGDICVNAPIFVMESTLDNEVKSAPIEVTLSTKQSDGSYTITAKTGSLDSTKKYLIDFYTMEAGANVQEIQITPDKFAGYFYVEADTLFRNQADGKDYPAQITIPNVKIQSAFTFSMSADGDPSTFTFTMDAFPGYTYFNTAKKVLCVIQVLNVAHKDEYLRTPVMDGVDKPTNGGLENESTTDDYFRDSVDPITTVITD